MFSGAFHQEFEKIFDHLLDVKADGSFRLNIEYFDYCTGLRMTNARFDELFGGPRRKPEELLTQRHMDLAASIQAVLEEAGLVAGYVRGGRSRALRPVLLPGNGCHEPQHDSGLVFLLRSGYFCRRRVT